MKIPTYVEKQEQSVKAKWISIFNEASKDEGSDVGLMVANLWLKRYLDSIAPTLERIQFEVDDSKPELVTRSENGQEYVSFKLADIAKDQFGIKMTPKVLQEWADKINNGANLQGDVDHQEYDRLLALGLSEEDIKDKLIGKNGLATAVQAIYEKGKLWVRALIDKRYKKVISKAKGVSMEALIQKDTDGNVLEGDLLGWTFAVNHNPAVSGTELAY